MCSPPLTGQGGVARRVQSTAPCGPWPSSLRTEGVATASHTPRGLPAVDTFIEDVISWTLTEVTEGDSGAPTTWWDRDNHQLPLGRTHGACGILSTDDVFGLTYRAADPAKIRTSAALHTCALGSPLACAHIHCQFLYSESATTVPVACQE
jgi:hypothetical protein